MTERALPNTNAPAYRIRELARTPHQPYLKGFELTVFGGDEGVIEHGLHEYVYNYGEVPVVLKWGNGRSLTLNHEDSAYVRPMVAHSYDVATPGTEGHLLTVRIPGKVNDLVLDEYATYNDANRHRVAGETMRWY